MSRHTLTWTAVPPPRAPVIQVLAVSKPEAGRALGVCGRTIGEMIRRGEIRAIKCGRRTVIPVSELHRLVGQGASP
jgi:excisionase family DNA binding protein